MGKPSRCRRRVLPCPTWCCVTTVSPWCHRCAEQRSPWTLACHHRFVHRAPWGFPQGRASKAKRIPRASLAANDHLRTKEFVASPSAKPRRLPCYPGAPEMKPDTRERPDTREVTENRTLIAKGPSSRLTLKWPWPLLASVPEDEANGVDWHQLSSIVS